MAQAKRKMAPYFIVDAPYSWSLPEKAILAFGDGTGIEFTAARLMEWKRNAEMWRAFKVGDAVEASRILVIMEIRDEEPKYRCSNADNYDSSWHSASKLRLVRKGKERK